MTWLKKEVTSILDHWEAFKMLLKQVLAKDLFSLLEMGKLYRGEKSISFHPLASETTYLLEDGFEFLVNH